MISSTASAASSPTRFFLLVHLFVFNDFRAVTVTQHVLGLLTGMLLWLAWRELVKFRYERGWLQSFPERLDHCLAAARRPENTWPLLGHNADYLLAVEPVFQGFFPDDPPGDRARRAFCIHYYA